jgi:hypothetical protein
MVHRLAQERKALFPLSPPFYGLLFRRVRLRGENGCIAVQL